jgi:hypothetical protein
MTGFFLLIGLGVLVYWIVIEWINQADEDRS